MTPQMQLTNQESRTWFLIPYCKLKNQGPWVIADSRDGTGTIEKLLRDNMRTIGEKKKLVLYYNLKYKINIHKFILIQMKD